MAPTTTLSHSLKMDIAFLRACVFKLQPSRLSLQTCENKHKPYWKTTVGDRPACELSPFHQLHGDEVVAVARVEEDEAVGGGGLELEEEVHGGVGLQRGQRQVAALGPKGHGVSDDVAHAEAGVELAVVDVAVLTQVDVEHTVEPGRGSTRVIITAASTNSSNRNYFLFGTPIQDGHSGLNNTLLIES